VEGDGVAWTGLLEGADPLVQVDRCPQEADRLTGAAEEPPAAARGGDDPQVEVPPPEGALPQPEPEEPPLPQEEERGGLEVRL